MVATVALPATCIHPVCAQQYPAIPRRPGILSWCWQSIMHQPDAQVEAVGEHVSLEQLTEQPCRDCCCAPARLVAPTTLPQSTSVQPCTGYGLSWENSAANHSSHIGSVASKWTEAQNSAPRPKCLLYTSRIVCLGSKSNNVAVTASIMLGRVLL